MTISRGGGWIRDRGTHTGRHARPVTDDYSPASLTPPPRWHCYSPFAAVPGGESLPLSFSPFFFFLILWGFFLPFPSSLCLPLLLLLLFPLQYLFSPYLSLRSPFFASLVPVWRVSCKVLPCPSQCKQGSAASSSLTGSPSLTATAFFPPWTPPVWVSSLPQLLLSVSLPLLSYGNTHLKCSGGTNKERQKEAKLCSQWHKREAERALETKSRNSARALQTERGDGEVGETKTHPLIQCSRYRPMTSPIQAHACADTHTHRHMYMQTCLVHSRTCWVLHL